MNSAYAKNNRVDLLYRFVFCDCTPHIGILASVHRVYPHRIGKLMKKSIVRISMPQQ